MIKLVEGKRVELGTRKEREDKFCMFPIVQWCRPRVRRFLISDHSSHSRAERRKVPAAH